jgi:hypothetical protein
MKKALTSVLVMSLTATFSPILKAQNLVPNWSFEDTLHCPHVLGQVNFCAHWQNFGNTPDYYNACAPSGDMSVPNTVLGYHNARTGHAMCGAINFGTFPDTNYREYIATQLISPLQSGTLYYVSFFISKCTAQVYTLCANKIGAKFTNVIYSMNNPPPFTNSAHVYTDSIMKDTVGWFKVKGTFVADSNYQ